MQSLVLSIIDQSSLSVALRLSGVIFPDDDVESAYRESIAQNDPAFRYYVAFHLDKPVGITGHYPDELSWGGDLLWLGWFGVDPSFRRRGIGRHLIYATIDRVRALGAERLSLWCEPDAKEAHAFYSSVGFLRRSQPCVVQGSRKVVFDTLI